MHFLYIGLCAVFLFLAPVCVLADFSACDDGPSSNQIWASFTLNTEQIPVPGEFSASLQVQLDTTVDTNVRAEVEIYRRVFWWMVLVPCVGSGQGVGSCSYDDLCALLNNVTVTCNGQPCRCPLGPGTYTFPNLRISTNNIHPTIRMLARNTDFYIEIKFFNKNSGALLSCMETELRTVG